MTCTFTPGTLDTMTSTRPPRDLQFKAAPALLEPRPGTVTGTDDGTPTDEGQGIVTGLAAVTGVRDDVGDIIEPGAMARTLRERTPQMCVAHDWGRVVGKVLAAVELLPGDPRLPATAPDGSPWPPEAGALWFRARYILATREGREAYEIAKAFGPQQGFSIGYKVTANGARHRAGTRTITDLDVYEISAVLHGANRLATQLSVKAAAAATLEYKATSGTGTVAMAAPRARGPYRVPVACDICGGSAGAMSGPLGAQLAIICRDCAVAVDEMIAGRAVLTDEHLAAADDVEPPPASLDAYAAAIDNEQGYELLPDGDLLQAGEDGGEQTGQAWRPGRTASPY